MADAIRDENHISTLTALSYIDGTTVVQVEINSSNGGMTIDQINTVSTSAMNAARDGNHRCTLMAVDLVTGNPIPIFANPITKGILIGNP